MSSFHTCSQILASISTYQYTRKAWKKDAMELLLDPTLFQMDDRSIQYWKIIIDNLMSQDTTTFRDFMGIFIFLFIKYLLLYFIFSYFFISRSN